MDLIPRPVIFDTDPGVDDALALLFAMAHPGIDLLGITTTFGNVSVEQASANALLLCALTGRELPVAQGVTKPLLKQAEPPPSFIHGADGLGNLPYRALPRKQADARSAAQFMVDTIRDQPGQVTIVAVGPLGNLALALALEPTLPQLVREVILMGGTIDEPGNVSPVAEANVWNDPHAADCVFTAGWPLTMVGLDVTHKVVVPLELMERIAAAQQHPAIDALLHAFRFYANFYASRHVHLIEKPGCYAHDLLAFIYLLAPEFFGVERGGIRVATEGLAQGQTMMSRHHSTRYPQTGWGPELAQSQACMTVDATACIDLFERTLMTQWLSI